MYSDRLGVISDQLWNHFGNLLAVTYRPRMSFSDQAIVAVCSAKKLSSCCWSPCYTGIISLYANGNTCRGRTGSSALSCNRSLSDLWFWQAPQLRPMVGAEVINGADQEVAAKAATHKSGISECHPDVVLDESLCEACRTQAFIHVPHWSSCFFIFDNERNRQRSGKSERALHAYLHGLGPNHTSPPNQPKP